MKEKTIVECCGKFWKNWAVVHLAAEIAARNGTPISIEKIIFCPYCGKKFEVEE